MRSVVVVPLVVLAVVASGCGGSNDDSPAARPSAASSTSSPPSAAASPSPAATTPASVRSSLELVPADQATVPKSGCRPQPKAGLVCARKAAYRFQPDAVRRAGVTRAEARQLDVGGWAVDVTLGPAGTRALASVTTAARKTNQVVLVMVPRTRRVILAAQVQTPITTGMLQVSGSFTEAEARRIVKQITRTAD